MSTVFIWNNNMVKVRGHTYAGHASMSINDKWRVQQDNTHRFVSAFPAGEAGFFNSVNLHASHNLVADLQIEGYAPDHIIRMNGLSHRDMKAEWQRIRNAANARYQFFRSSCATAVSRVLKAGGASASRWRSHHAIWTPLRVKRFALAAGGTKMTFAALLAELENDGAISADERAALGNMKKRTDKHGNGSSMAVSYLAGGRRIANRDHIISNNRFEIYAGGAPRVGATETRTEIDSASGNVQVNTYTYTEEDFVDEDD